MRDVTRRTGRAFARLAIFCILVLIVTGVGARASENGAEERAVRSAIESYLRRYQEEAMEYEGRDLRFGTAADPNVPLSAEMEERTFTFSGKTVTLAQLRENMLFWEKKAAFYAGMRQLQGIYREGLDLSYALEELKMDGDSCRASVRETAEFRYTDSDRPSVYETFYDVRLIRLEGRWLVADVTDESQFDKQYKRRGSAFDENEALAEFAGQLAGEGCTVFFPYTASDAGDRILYNGENAAAYAYTYSRRHKGTPRADFYNGQFAGYAGSGGDCQNFASQCMWAGFGGSQVSSTINSRVLPMDGAGSSQWFGRAAGGGKLNNSWVSCQTFRQYLTGSQDGTGRKGSNAAGDAGMYATVLDVDAGSPLSGVTAEELVGATAHVEGSGGAYSHAIVLTAATGNNRSEIWFCGHTKDVTHVKLGDCYIGPMKVYIPRYMRTGGEPAGLIRTERLQPVQAGSTQALTARMDGVQRQMTITVTAPNGAAEQVAAADYADSCRGEYLFSDPGLYRVDCRARESENAQTASVTYYVRCYGPEAFIPSGEGAWEEAGQQEDEPETDYFDSDMPAWLRQTEE